MFGAFPLILQPYDILGLRTAIALNDIQLNALAFIQRFVAVAYDRTEMYEHVVAAIYGNKTITFFCVKPFHYACLHTVYHLVLLFYMKFLIRLQIKNSHIVQGY